MSGPSEARQRKNKHQRGEVPTNVITPAVEKKGVGGGSTGGGRRGGTLGRLNAFGILLTTSTCAILLLIAVWSSLPPLEDGSPISRSDGGDKSKRGSDGKKQQRQSPGLRSSIEKKQISQPLTTINALSQYTGKSIRGEGDIRQHGPKNDPSVQVLLRAFIANINHNHTKGSEAKSVILPYDIVSHALDASPYTYSVVHQLSSIPNRRRMLPSLSSTLDRSSYHVPLDAVNNLSYFLKSRSRPDEEDRPLYIYNPMVLPLNEKYMDASLLNALRMPTVNKPSVYQSKQIPPLPAPLIQYVGVYRISNFANCHGPGRGVPETYRNYLGLALLDGDLNLVPHLQHSWYRKEPEKEEENPPSTIDIVIDLNNELAMAGWIREGAQSMQDCQLISTVSSSKQQYTEMKELKKKNDRLILLCNEYAIHVSLTMEQHIREDEASFYKKRKGELHVFRNKYGTGLRLSALGPPQVIVKGAKNLHLVQSISGGIVNVKDALGKNDNGYSKDNGASFLELWPGGPHEMLPINFGSDPFFIAPPSNLIKGRDSSEEPDPTFMTVDKSISSKTRDKGNTDNNALLMARDSGSVCCVSVRWKDGRDQNDGIAEGTMITNTAKSNKTRVKERDLLLGISHRKTRRGMDKKTMYNYVSRVYAFEPNPPFHIVARSGFFCLGFANATGASTAGDRSDNEQVRGAANNYKLEIRGQTFNCPRIHFVTGIAEKVGDEDKVIISYGVNDCYPRMIEVSKEFLVTLLHRIGN